MQGSSHLNQPAAADRSSSRRRRSVLSQFQPRITRTGEDAVASNRLNVLICSANVGNAEPSPESLAAWIPENGDVSSVVRDQPYPLPPPGRLGVVATVSSGRNGDAEDGNEVESSDDSNSLEDESFDLEGLAAALSGPRSFDIVVIGMQEAAFRLKKSSSYLSQGSAVSEENGSGSLTRLSSAELNVPDDWEEPPPPPSTSYLPSTYKADTDNGVSPSGRRTKFANVGRDSVLRSSIAKTTSPVRAVAKRASTGMKTIKSVTASKDLTRTKGASLSDAKLLQMRIRERLPSYSVPVAFLRGEMILMVLVRSSLMHEVSDVECRAENTGIGSVLANKGGIVATLTIRKTRLAFISAHLEAHEGAHHYVNRCKNLAEIFAGARVGPAHLRHFDGSMIAHHCFVCGDLNFRVILPGKDDDDADEEPSQPDRRKMEDVELIRSMIEREDWDGINDCDELAKALHRHDCLAGFKTLKCNFPPTFKVERGEGFVYNEKRIPSYTDRILWKSSDGLDANVGPLAYEPCPDFVTSDHKPVRGAFAIETNAERSKRRRSTFVRRSRMGVVKMLSEVRRRTVRSLHFFVTKLECSNLNVTGAKPNPYIMFLTDPKDLLWEGKKNKNLDKNEKEKKRKKGWPRTPVVGRSLDPKWEESVHLRIVGVSSIEDIAGALLYVACFNDLYNDDKLIGGTVLNIRKLCSEILPETPPPMRFRWASSKQFPRGPQVRRTQRTEIHRLIERKGKVYGVVQFSIEAGWLTDAEVHERIHRRNVVNGLT